MPVLLLCADADASSAIVETLAARGLAVATATDGESGLAMAVGSQLVIIDQSGGRLDPVMLCARLRQTPEVADVPILCLAASEDVEERVRFLEAGADDVMARPFDAAELEARVDGLLARSRRSRTTAVQVSAGGPGGMVKPGVDVPRLIGFFGPKGGSGTTTLAVNTAVAIAMRRVWQVALADLDLQWGDVGVLLNLSSRQPITDLARDSGALGDPDTVDSYGSRHASGLAVFPAPPRPDVGETLDAGVVAHLLTGLRDTYGIVLVDAGSNLDPVSLTVFEHADRLVVPVIPEIPALRAVRTLLEMLSETDRDPASVVLVLEHVFARDMLRTDDIERALGRRIDLEVPFDASLFLAAANAGEPFVTGAARSTPAERVQALATRLVGDGMAAPAASGGASAAGRRFPSLLKRGSTGPGT